MLQKLVDGIHQFQNNVFADQRKFFEKLATGQSPQGLFITCSDSRINPNLITQTDPGELFILRNVGNIVPPYSPNTADGATAAAIEYASTALNVDYIIICGHSHCGAMHGVLNKEALKNMPSVGGWLAHAESTYRIMRDNYPELDAEAKLNIAIQENVLCQMENLRTHPSVAVRIARGDLQIYGWIYKLETGEVFSYDPGNGQFVGIHQRREHVAANRPRATQAAI
jgi:carbonic anhydrase